MTEKKELSYLELKRRLNEAESELHCLHEDRVEIIRSESGTLEIYAGGAAREHHIKQVLLTTCYINQLIIHEIDRQRLVEDSCASLTIMHSYQTAWIALFDEYHNLIMFTSSGFGDGSEETRHLLASGEIPNCIGRTLEEDELVVIDDPVSYCGNCPVMKNQTGRAILSHKLAYNGKVYGIISVSIPAAYSDDKEECNLFREIVGNLSFALFRLELEEQRKTAEKERIDILESISDAFFALDDRMVVTYFNGAAARHLKKQADEVVGKPLFDVFPEGRGSIFEKKYLQAIRTRKAIAFETFFDVDPYRNWYDVRIYPRARGISVYFLVTTRRNTTIETLARQKNELSAIFYGIGDAVIATDAEGMISRMNPVAEKFTGWTEAEALGRELGEVFCIVNEEMHYLPDKTFYGMLHEKGSGELPCYAQLTHKDGGKRPISYSCSIIRNHQEEGTGYVFVFTDKTEERLTRRLLEMRFTLIEYAANHTLEELLTRSLDEVGAFVESPIGFYHFVEPDQQTVFLQQWSTRTLKEFCRAEGKGSHYSIEKGGVWADCVREKKPVIHNDYASLPRKKGLPEGHAGLAREMLIPVIRDDRIVAILGVGNKSTDYTEGDMEVVSYLADLTWEIVRYKRAEEELRESRERLNSAQLVAKMGDFTWDVETGRVTWSDTLYDLLQFDRSIKIETARANLNIIHRDDRSRATRWLNEALKSGTEELAPNEYRLECRDGRILDVRTMGIIERREGKAVKVFATVQDISKQKKAEEENKKLQAQFAQAQKMESVGRLAGGVAHDFNNMLTLILGHTELAFGQVDPSQPLYNDLKEIHSAARRSANLTRQLLAFARRQTITPRLLDLNETVGNMLKMLQRLIGEDIDLAWVPGLDLEHVFVDPAQVDQIMANLCVNARDAISGIGRITIETHNATLSEEYCAERPGFLPGDYVMLAVSDNGCGMEKEIMDKIFEPFFTTKDRSKGTGLGLATVYGITKQNNGFINVYSEPGNGTAFKIYFPRYAAESKPRHSENISTVRKGSGETILLVEDELTILNLGRMMLERLDYQILTANSPSEAIRLAREHPQKIDLLITDVVMPEMNGHDLADYLKTRSPDLKILYMSGYTADVIAHHGVLKKGMKFIQKPFSIMELANKVHEVLTAKE
ncbi:MAG: GAF domain-containing protein [Desulfobulbaceae bacterium]|nr:GAF domain-containing protein [Desulfobulbaceae bacterium]